MRNIIFILFLTCQMLLSYELVVIGSQNFPREELSVSEIRAIFLDKKPIFVEEDKTLVMNYRYNHPLRHCFEETILQKSQRSLARYWRKAYYQGKQPPKIITSTKMLFGYLESVQPSIGYSEKNATMNKGIKVLYRGQCE